MSTDKKRNLTTTKIVLIFSFLQDTFQAIFSVCYHWADFIHFVPNIDKETVEKAILPIAKKIYNVSLRK